MALVESNKHVAPSIVGHPFYFLAPVPSDLLDLLS